MCRTPAVAPALLMNLVAGAAPFNSDHKVSPATAQDLRARTVLGHPVPGRPLGHEDVIPTRQRSDPSRCASTTRGPTAYTEDLDRLSAGRSSATATTSAVSPGFGCETANPTHRNRLRPPGSISPKRRPSYRARDETCLKLHASFPQNRARGNLALQARCIKHMHSRGGQAQYRQLRTTESRTSANSHLRERSTDEITKPTKPARLPKTTVTVHSPFAKVARGRIPG